MTDQDFVIPQNMPEIMKDHLLRYLKDGEDGHLWDCVFAGGKGPTPTLLLFTVGRKSGNKIVTPVIYGKSGDDYVVIASKGGAPSHPNWYLNMQANPEFEIQVVNDRFKVKARDASDQERGALWDMMVDIYPPYADYQEKTSRKIPVVILERQ